MKKSLALAIAMGMMSNLCAMHEAENSSSSSASVFKQEKLHMGRRPFYTLAQEHSILKAKRDILAVAFKKNFAIKRLVPEKTSVEELASFETQLVNTDELQSFMFNLGREEKSKSFIWDINCIPVDDEDISTVNQYFTDMLHDKAVFKAQIEAMEKILGLAREAGKTGKRKKNLRRSTRALLVSCARCSR